MKTCTKCKTPKVASEFYKSAGNKDGLKGHCIQCHAEYDFNRERYDFGRIFARRHNDIKRRSEGTSSVKSSAAGKPYLTLPEFLEWCEEQLETFKLLHEAWADADFKHMLSPTIDRKDNKLGYIKSNIQWLPFGENRKKGTK